ncbi:sensor histidine kinase [Haloferula sp.]|uniref:sensor histidine kinase n=1 Tax=Haloferula sp. TaxID=2497595 RepID=UPI003C78D0F1
MEGTSIEVFVGTEKKPQTGPDLKVPAGTGTLRFAVSPQSLFARYKLQGLDENWVQRVDNMFLRVVFFNSHGDQIQTQSFPVSGRSSGWKYSLEDSLFTPRTETVAVPRGAVSISLNMSTAGPSSLVGVFAIKDVNVTSTTKQGAVSKVLMSDSFIPGTQKPPWNKSGTHPSMATRSRLGGEDGSSLVLVIVDDDISAHADWAARIRIPAGVDDGGTLKLSWKEAFSSGLGGNFTAIYERLPAGNYRFLVEDLSLTGEPLQSVTAVSLIVPRVYWKSFWFWGTTGLILSLISVLIGRYLVRRRIRRHLDQERMISEERRRIALDLHDDIGTRVSHISLVASHADNTIQDREASQAFEKISSMSRDLIGALSETVWMLNSNNEDLESLVDFLYRLVNELCRLKKIRCRVDAVFITENQPISYQFRHNVSLAVKESVNNVLKHSEATKLDMKIELERNVLLITITDNGIGISEETRSFGLGLENLNQRMKSIGGTCRFEHLEEGGLRILFAAPLEKKPKNRNR